MEQWMSTKELRKFYDRKAALLKSEETLAGLREYHSALYAAAPDNPSIGALQDSIEQLAASNEMAREELAEKIEAVKATLRTIDDVSIRIFATLHFHEGLPWERVAAIVGKSKDSVKSSVCRYFHKAGI